MNKHSLSSPLTLMVLGLAVILLGWGGEPCWSQDNFLPNMIKQCQPKMAKIIGAGAGRVDGYASGIVISPDGLILTSQGVFLDGRQLRVELSDGSAWPATVLRRNRTLQLALLKIEADHELDHFELSDKDVGEKGDWVVALSNAFKVANESEPMSAMIGIISLRSTIEARLNDRDVAYKGPLILIDAITSNPGASGGAVVNAETQLVGMIGKLINSSETNTRINYAVPCATLKEFVDGKAKESAALADSAENNGGAKADLGIILFNVGSRNDPAYVDRIRRRSPAAKLGLKGDDLIVAIDGVQIGTVAEYQKVVDRLTPGVAITVVLKRGPDLLRLSITPEEKK